MLVFPPVGSQRLDSPMWRQPSCPLSWVRRIASAALSSSILQNHFGVDIIRARQEGETWVMVTKGRDTTIVVTEEYQWQQFFDGSLQKAIPITESAKEHRLSSQLYGKGGASAANAT